jgi:hypothetical protein
MYLKKFNNYKIVFSIKVLKLKGHNKKIILTLYAY